jgi:hypothetical protein
LEYGLGLTFLNVGFLFAALAALVPLIIHLISRRRVETVDWSSLRFLRELERKRIRRVRLRQILLLIVRSLIILTVALALARPTLSGTVLEAGGHAKTSIAVVLDDSASMSRSTDGGDLMSAAVGVALRIADLLDEGDQAFLVMASDPPRDARPGGTFSRDALVDEIGATEAGAGATDYVGAIDLGAELLSGARNLNRELYLIGDMQATGWADEGAGPTSPPPGAGDAPVRTYVVPIEGPEGNLGVASVSVARRYGGTAGLLSITAEVANHGRRPVEVPVRLFVDGVQVGQAGAGIEPGGSSIARFATSLTERDWHAGWAELPEDVLAIDNRRYFVVPPVEPAEVLVVRPGPADEADEEYYVSRALDPTGAGERFRPVGIAVADLEDQEHGRFAVVILADVGRLGAGGESWLARHLSEGGGLLVVLGSRTDIRYWNGDSSPLASRVVLREPVDRERGHRLAPSGTGHPLLEGLTVGDRLIDDVSVRRAFAAEITGGEEVLEFPGIGPALAFVGSEPSEIAVLLTGIDPAWNGLPRSGLLVPLLHRVVDRLAGGGLRSTQVVVGEDLLVPVEGPSPGRIEAALPDGSTLEPEIRGGFRPSARLERVRIPGIYRFSDGRRDVSLGAVNPDPSESALAPASREAIEGHLAGWQHRFVEAGDRLSDQILEARRGRELWRVFVYAALALLAVEMFLARPRFV